MEGCKGSFGKVKMKQSITVNQLNKLSDKAKISLQNWWKPKEGDFYVCPDFVDEDMVQIVDVIRKDKFGKLNGLLSRDHTASHLPLLSIGQMIDFLDKPDIDVRWDSVEKKWGGYINGTTEHKEELCDLFWEAVKKVLEK